MQNDLNHSPRSKSKNASAKETCRQRPQYTFSAEECSFLSAFAKISFTVSDGTSAPRYKMRRKIVPVCSKDTDGGERTMRLIVFSPNLSVCSQRYAVWIFLTQNKLAKRCFITFTASSTLNSSIIQTDNLTGSVQQRWNSAKWHMT